MTGQRRLSLIKAHLLSRFPPLSVDDSLDKYRARTEDLNSEVLFHTYFGKISHPLLHMRKLMIHSPLFNKYNEIEMSIDHRRSRVLEQIEEIYFKFNLNHKQDIDDHYKTSEMMFAFGEYELAITTKMAVTIFLYGDTVQSIGTAKHIPLIERAFSFKDFGCIAMTELGHGSNVAMVETTASYEHTTREFTINSPTATSAKWWVGGAGKTSNMTALFARLIVDNVDRGVHVFAIKIRDENHDPMPGVILGDCGKKLGLDAIDNGFLLFKDYRCSYDCLLDKLSSIDSDGKFNSSVKNNDKRLGIIIGGIIRGRISVISGSEIHIRIALTIALRYAAIRKQFAKKDSPESPILDYQTHQLRLIPHMAKMFAIRATAIYLMDQYSNVKSKAAVDPECIELTDYHAILSCLKGLVSSFGIVALQECREACGGHGFSAFSVLGHIRNNQDIHTTWEGDNTILMQQTGKILLKQAQNLFKGEKTSNPNLQYLNVDFDQIKAYKAPFTDRESLLNEKLLMELIEYRVNYAINNSINALRENAANSPDVIDAWNNSQVHYVQEIGKAYGEYILASRLLVMVNDLLLKCQKTGNLVRNIFFLFVIERIEKNLGHYLENALNAEQAKLIRDTEIYLCRELRDISIKIIDVIAVPDQFLGSVLGESDGQVYAKMINAVEHSKRVYKKPTWLPLLQRMQKLRDN